MNQKIKLSMTPKQNGNKGFSLIELMVVIALSSIVAAAIYSFYDYYQKTYIVQEGIVTMQQNLRSAMYCMENDIRMAGYNPRRTGSPRMLEAKADRIRFSYTADEDERDNDGDGVTDETGELEDVAYSIYTEDGIEKLGRKITSQVNQMPVAENIDVLDFVYLDRDGDVLPDDDGDGNIDNISRIRSVQITIIAKAGRSDTGYTDNKTYINQKGQEILPAPNDHFRRRMMTSQVRCRNLGLSD